MSLIRVTGLTVRYGGRTALDNVALEIDEGEIVTLIGPNGSGKSTLVRVLLGALPANRGTVWRRPGLRIGYVPQRLMIDATMPLSVARFLALPVRPERAELDGVAAATGIDRLMDRQMTELSGGQFQRALLARALLARPGLLLLDEPTQGLDQPGVAAFYKLVEQVRRDTGCAVLLVGHDLHVVMSASDRVICLNGHVCCQGAPSTVTAAPEYRALFGMGTEGTMALYRHEHDHMHDHAQTGAGNG